MATPLNTFVSGAAFGAALLTAGVHSPAIIVNQLKFTDWRMVQAFLTATAGSAIIVLILDVLRDPSHPSPFKPRKASTLHVLPTRYDGNLVGGALLGAGMALAGICPGTVLVQAGVGVPSGIFALGGAVLGGLAYAAWVRPAVAARRKLFEEAKGSVEAGVEEKHAVYEQLGVGRVPAVAVKTALFAAVVGATVVLAPSPPSPVLADSIVPLAVVGGGLIALAQLGSVLLRRGQLLGVSSLYEEAGDYLVGVAGHVKRYISAVSESDDTVPEKDAAKTGGQPALNTSRGLPLSALRPSASALRSLVFASGVSAGAFVLSRAVPALLEVRHDGTGGVVAIPPALAVLGGFVATAGARVAGGCTSGHGISGLSLLSTSSLVTMTAAFAGGGLVALFVY